jgi:hypothetical protein
MKEKRYIDLGFFYNLDFVASNEMIRNIFIGYWQKSFNKRDSILKLNKLISSKKIKKKVF